jgi:ribosomal protein S18 acetylase RimI-like enzyme
MKKIRIVTYEPWHQPYFEKFNRHWIESLFRMEPVDEFVLKQPEKAILVNGGAIFIALYNEEVAGTVALRKIDSHTYEFTKMAVDVPYRRKGIAEALCIACFQTAKEWGASRIILYSNTKNEAAIRLYEKAGFVHIPVEKGVYERANVKMEISLKNITEHHLQ